ncbi:MAG TPA: glutamine--tRNA ligase/YqeY domain fusion protein [Caldithrix abyssi]|uniref:Glutamine--tRNA ligase n=1 Tax=Caldithrix abyssi TaxID=187145 RepID=A0A7V1LNW1_CALAY|nr:glutamine--tRNA ligase/YqeY domain fusion protein [Caldithrix abyssi]
MSDENKPVVSNFIRTIIDNHNATKRFGGKVQLRFPPEPNGFLHIGHAKSICLNFGLARDYNGKCNLRFDDTNPVKEEDAYVKAIKEDIRWLGFEWDKECYASDYFDTLYEYAVRLVKKGLAYVDDLSSEEIRAYRGTLKEPGKNSPWRDRSVEENLDLLERMKTGEFPDGTKVLRARIDMSSPNMNMRDPVMYRILHARHHRTGDKWCIYPMYDWAHGQSDSIEGVTHSICTLEFEDHRPLYEWFLEKLEIHKPQQIEFARLNLTYTLMSKRKLLKLVNEGIVDGWDDPRMPTIAGMRRRGVTPAALRNFSESVGVAKSNSVVDVAQFDFAIREDLNKTALRAMAVMEPIRLVIEDYPEGKTEWLEGVNNPEDDSAGKRKIPFERELYIERNDFMIDPPKKYFRLAPGREVRLKHAYYVTCTRYETDGEGKVTTVYASHDPETRGGWSDDGRKVKGTLHWVAVNHAVSAEVRLYDHLFNTPNPGEARDDDAFYAILNKESLKILPDVKVEPVIAACAPGARFQFLRQGYFCADIKEHSTERPVFNRTATLRDSWAKTKKKS